MSYEEMEHHVDSAISLFPTLRVLVISGGECTLLGDDLDKIISHGYERGLITRIVTNASWATSYDTAYNRLVSLKRAGLCEFNVSTGRQHQKFVKPQYVINAVLAAVNLGICPAQIAYEKHADSSLDSEEWRNDETIS